MRYEVTCDYCGKRFVKYVLYRHNFCNRDCLAKFTSKATNPEGYKSLKDYTSMSANMTEINREFNGLRMDLATRTKIREAHLGTGEGKSYEKRYGKHAHRRVMEHMLGRNLKPGEVVHHIDGDKRNNAPENLMLFESQKAHAAFHRENGDFVHRGGDAK